MKPLFFPPQSTIFKSYETGLIFPPTSLIVNGKKPFAWWYTDSRKQRIINAGNISDLLDVTGNSNDMSQITAASQPSLNVKAQNNRDTANGDGIDDYMNIGVALTAETTMFFIFDREVSYNNAYLIGGDDPGTASPAIIQNFDPGDGVKAFEFLDIQGASSLRETFSVNATGYHMLAVTHDDNASTPKTRGYFDGSPVFSGDGAALNTTQIDHLFTNFIFANFSDSNFCEGAIYRSILSVDEIALLSVSRKRKWGIA